MVLERRTQLFAARGEKVSVTTSPVWQEKNTLYCTVTATYGGKTYVKTVKLQSHFTFYRVLLIGNKEVIPWKVHKAILRAAEVAFDNFV